MQTQSKNLADIMGKRKASQAPTTTNRFSFGAQMKLKNGHWENSMTGQKVSDFLLFKNTNQPNRTTGVLKGSTLNITPW